MKNDVFLSAIITLFFVFLSNFTGSSPGGFNAITLFFIVNVWVKQLRRK